MDQNQPPVKAQSNPAQNPPPGDVPAVNTVAIQMPEPTSEEETALRTELIAIGQQIGMIAHLGDTPEVRMLHVKSDQLGRHIDAIRKKQGARTPQHAVTPQHGQGNPQSVEAQNTQPPAPPTQPPAP